MLSRTVQLFQMLQGLLFGHSRARLPDGVETRSNLAVGQQAPLLERPSSLIWLLIAAVPFYVLLAVMVPPWDDELYYWCWSQDLQFSYYDHPPMVAYMIRLSTAIFGHHMLAIRFPCLISALAVLGVVTHLSRPRTLIPFVFLSPVPTFAAVMITPDIPLLLFWSLSLLWLVRTHAKLADGEPIRSSHWVLGGIILGCGVLGKYTTGLAVISGFCSFVAAGQWRRWISGYSLHGLVSLFVASPIFIHNLRQDFAPILFQWEHAMSNSEPGLLPLADFLGVQWLLFGSFPFFVFGWGLWNWKSLRGDARLRVCAALFLLPFAFFLYKSTRGYLQGNWSFPCYLACWPLAAEIYRRNRENRTYRNLAAASFLLPLGTSIFIALHAIHPLPLMPPDSDRATRQWDKMELMEKIVADIHASGYTGPIYAPTYQWVAVLRWYGLDARQIDNLTRPSHFTERKNPPIDPAQYVVFEENRSPVPIIDLTCSSHHRIIASREFRVRDTPWTYLHVVDYSVPPASR